MQYNFTVAGATGQYGPTQEQVVSAYAGTSLERSVTVNKQGLQEWTVPVGGTYLVQGWGAQGGLHPARNTTGGQGALVRGRFSFQTGHKLYIVVGQMGHYGGGGGGSFVYNDTDDPKLIAAGGGGASWKGDSGGRGNDGPHAGEGAFRVAIKDGLH